MAKGRQQRLVTAILTAKFRPDRQGGLLLDDELPDEMPVAGSEEAQERWAGLVALQKGYIAREVPHPWEFQAAVRAFHSALAKSQLYPWTRSTITFDLETGCRDFPDEELARHWREWAQFERDWDESTFAHKHFIEGKSADLARCECFAESARRSAADMEERSPSTASYWAARAAHWEDQAQLRRDAA